MPNPRNYVYTDLAAKDALQLEIAGVLYEVTQYTAAWAANTLPVAQCMLAIGRNARNLQAAAIHTNNRFTQMYKAKVWFHPQQEYAIGQNWPEGRRVIFDGFLTGFSYRKINGKIHMIASLLLGLAAFGFWSSLTKLGHPTNPSQLNAAAVMMLPNAAGAAPVGAYISSLASSPVQVTDVAADLWSAIKSLFCALAGQTAYEPGVANICGRNPGSALRNDVALEALNRMEGPVGVNSSAAARAGCPSVPYHWGAPLRLFDTPVTIAQGIAQSIGNETVNSYASTTFWDKLIGTFCPYFGMAVVPMVDTAIVVADTPALGGSPGPVWREIDVVDYDSLDQSGELHRPLRGVGVVTGLESQTGANTERSPVSGMPLIGGCFVPDDLDDINRAEGVTMFVEPPGWLRMLLYTPNYALVTTNVNNGGASPTATAPGGGNPPPTGLDAGTLGIPVNGMFSRYARWVYMSQMLRGRAGSFSGKLRFDIAPLSIVKLSDLPERFIGGEDNLAVTLYGCVQRVTVAINAESGAAGTTFTLSHLRTEAENGSPRTSVTGHPLFGDSIHGAGKHGSPLIDAYDL